MNFCIVLKSIIKSCNNLAYKLRYITDNSKFVVGEVDMLLFSAVMVKIQRG